MAFDLNNFVINRPIRAGMFHSSTGEQMWTITQITDPTLNVSSETTTASDCLGMPIMQFNRGKTAEFSASNSLFDLSLLAAQSGTSKVSSTAVVTYSVPIWETFTVPTPATTVTLAHTPAESGADGIPYIYKLTTAGDVSAKYAYAASPGAETFGFSGATLTFPTGFTAGEQFLVYYEYTATATSGDQAVRVVNTATNFPSAGKFVIECLGSSVCDISTEYRCFIMFPAAKLSSDFDITFNTEGKHPFKITAFQEYCDTAKTLFSVVFPESD